MILVQPRSRPFKQSPGRVDTRPMVTLELTLAEGEAMKSWFLKPAADSSAATENLSDDQVGDLGRRIAESPIRRYAGNGH